MAIYAEDVEKVFGRYLAQLYQRDLAASTRARYAQVLCTYERFLENSAPSKESALDFIAELRRKGYRRRAVNLYGHVIRDFFRKAFDQDISFKARKVRDLPDYHAFTDISSILAQAEEPPARRLGDEARRERNYALLGTLAFKGLRRTEATDLRGRRRGF